MILAMNALDKAVCPDIGLGPGFVVSKQAEWSRIHCAIGAEPVTLSGDDGEQLGSAAGVAGMQWDDR